MKAKVITLDAKESGSIDLDDAVFGLPERADILQRIVLWQLAKRRAGTHSVLNRGEVSGTTKKFVRQKGSGGARHGNRKVNQFRGWCQCRPKFPPGCCERSAYRYFAGSGRQRL